MVSAKRVLVTGASGFVGRHVVERLVRAGHSVVGCGSQTASVSSVAGEIEHHRVDLRDGDAVAALVRAVRPDWVVHLAAVAFVADENVDAFYEVNLLGTRRLLAALAASPGLERALVVSSASVYGHGDGRLLTEKAPIAPVNDYGVSKAAMEQVCSLFADRVPIVVARPFNHTGVGQEERFLVPKIVAHHARREPSIRLGNIEVARDFTDVRDVAAAYLELLAGPFAGEVFNIASGRAVSLREVIAMCGRLTGHVIAVESDPRFQRTRDIASLAGDKSKLCTALGDFRPRPLEETIAWMLGLERE